MKTSESQRRASKKWDDANKEKVLQYQRNYYLRNKERVNERNKANYRKRKKPDAKDIPVPAKVKIPKTVLIQTLRDNPKHYLYNKEVFNWTEKDLSEFQKLLTA